MAVPFLLQLICCAVFFSLLLSVVSESDTLVDQDYGNSKSSLCSELFVGISGSDSMTFMRTLREGQTLVSSGGRFVFGFFSPGGTSGRRYLGVCYWNLSSPVVWVANRDRPITGAGELELTATGILVLYDDTGLIWRVNPTRAARRPILQLLDSGNLVLRDATGEDGYLWQSFDHPCNILLPGMKLGWDLKTGRQRNMTSWRSWDDPAAGDVTLCLESPELPQLVLRIAGEAENRWGPWDGSKFSAANPNPNPNFKQILISSHEEVCYTFSVPDGPLVPVMLELNQEGLISYLTHSEEGLRVATFPKDSCDRYGSCGPNGYCYYHDHEPNCRCFDGFVPKYSKDWGSMDWSGGCTRRRRLSYGNGDGFVRFSGLKLPDHPRPPKDHNKLSQPECEMECSVNSSCTAYTVVGFGCVMWFGDLLDMRTFPFGGQDIYVRMSPQEIESINHEKRMQQIRIMLFIVVSVVCMMCVLIIIGWKVIIVLKEKRTAREEIQLPVEPENHGEAANEDGMDQLSLYDMATLSVATNQFSSSNKIGQGGFGLVYKGVLPNGQEIAVKRLSRSTSQGLQQFKNEVVLIAKLQHRNLVRLLGCCIQGEERMLIYEYMPNKSLDYFLFDKSRSHLLIWETRFNIIMGIARGLLYLHEDSRLRIIHRDLKTSNILLDSGMTPKISDFGIASIFGGDQTEEMTRRVLGTYGYMSPEYAIRGHFSVKSDVFSFGVLLLEVISGTNNWSFRHPDHDFNLLGHAWKLWNEGNVLELVDPFMEASIRVEQVMRCIQVGLLCVQQRTDDRPIISSIIFMLSNETASLPQPKEPGFFSGTYYSGTGYMEPWSGDQNICTTELTTSDIQGR